MDLVSLAFLLFAAVTVAVYYALPARLRPVWLLMASVFFYLRADVRCGLFLLLSILSCYAAALLLPKTKRKRLLLFTVLALNLGLMAALKLLPWLMAQAVEEGRLRLLYPLGLSFYSLQAAGYVIDVYRGRIRAEKSLWRFALFMSFFPIVSQGPISRYEQLAPQLVEASGNIHRARSGESRRFLPDKRGRSSHMLQRPGFLFRCMFPRWKSRDCYDRRFRHFPCSPAGRKKLLLTPGDSPYRQAGAVPRRIGYPAFQ